jgi:hypothetical protein
MSLINDALKQARQAPPRQAPNVVPPLQAVDEEASPVWGWLILALIVLLVVAGIFFIGWSVAHQRVRSIVADADSLVTTQAVAAVPASVVPTPAPEPVPFNPPDAPVLQGIFYSPTAPSAIVNGKTVRPGSRLDQYLVKEITKYAVTLVGPDKKEIRLGMGR